MSENWMVVNGYEGRYEISDEGRVRTIPHVKKTGAWQKQIMLKLRPAWNGYIVVKLFDGERYHHHLVHRLVYENFIGSAKGFDVNHIDENKTNNALENLNLLTHKENSNYGTGKIRGGLKRIGNDNGHNKRKTLLHYADGRDFYFESLSAAARFLDLSPATLIKYKDAGRSWHTITIKYV